MSTDQHRTRSLEEWLKVIGSLVAILGLPLTACEVLETQKSNAETRKVEARQPFAQTQLELYTDAAKQIAIIASSTGGDSRDAALDRFQQLVAGELAVVESAGVHESVERFAAAVFGNKKQPELTELARDVASEFRSSLAVTWQHEIWQKPKRDSE